MQRNMVEAAKYLRFVKDTLGVRLVSLEPKVIAHPSTFINPVFWVFSDRLREDQAIRSLVERMLGATGLPDDAVALKFVANISDLEEFPDYTIFFGFPEASIGEIAKTSSSIFAQTAAPDQFAIDPTAKRHAWGELQNLQRWWKSR